MAYNSEDYSKSDGKNCIEHRWPNGRPGGNFRSIGSVEYEICSGCLAMRIVWNLDLLIDGKWIRKTDTQIVEPNTDTKQE